MPEDDVSTRTAIEEYVLLDAPGSARSGTGSFAGRLAAAFALVALMTAVISVGMLALVWNQSFEQYRRSSMEHIATAVAQKTGTIYSQVGEWRFESLAPVVEYSGISDLAVRIVAPNGTVLADSSGIDQGSLNSLGVLSQLRGSAFTSEPRQKVSAPVVVNGELVATVHVWTYGQNTLLSQNDLDFRSGTYLAVGIAALVAVFLASLSGLAFSGRLVDPINRITDVASAIRAGDLSARTEMPGGDEISDLGKTFDEMARSIEQDRLLERRLTSDVAHELRTPLMAIQATVEAMQDGVLPADEEHLATVGGETVRLSRLVDAILELTRLERGSLPFEMAPVDISELVASAVSTHGALFDAVGLTLTSSITPGVMITADPDRIRQAVGNLLSNAARYTPEGGEVAVSVTSDACDAIVEVADTGIGIQVENLEKVFSRFWRADEARNRANGGLGIGLSVTKEIVDRHEGSISARRRPEGGSVFSLRIPLLSPLQPEPCDRPGRSRQLFGRSTAGKGSSDRGPSKP